MKNKGFTLIELIVVFVVISLLSTISIQLFVDYNGKQTFDSGTKSVVTALQTARSRAMSQVKPTYNTRCNDNDVLQGYSIDIDKIAGAETPDKIDIFAICRDPTMPSFFWWSNVPEEGGDTVKVATIYTPRRVKLTYSHHNDEYFFKVLTGGVEYQGDGNDGDVDGSGLENICVRYKGRLNVITVYLDGRIIVTSNYEGTDSC